MKFHLTILVFFIASMVLVVAQTYDDAFDNLTRNRRVSIDISGTNDNEKIVQSYLARELRSLGDMEIVDYQPDYALKIIVVDITLGGNQAGYAIAFLALNVYGELTFNNVSRHLIPPSQREGYLLSGSFEPEYYQRNKDAIVNSYRQIESYRLIVIPEEKLRQACEEYVAQIDTQLFESTRRLRQLLKAPSQ